MINRLFCSTSQSFGIACAAMVVAVTSFHSHGPLVTAHAAAQTASPVTQGVSKTSTAESAKSRIHQVDFLPGMYHNPRSMSES